ncbi:unnamed protein product [Caenorhabditis sp. 36 PRJEB53466]|nr:unnamed protein product [Caenorhabditis sp. 36 PRJEB53466]
MSRFAGKVAIITGSSNGIGRATAVLFAKEGAQVTITGRNAERLEETRDEILKAGVAPNNVNVVVADITFEAGQDEVIGSTVSKFGKINILVNNAGAAFPDKNQPMGFGQGIDNFDATLAVNIRSVVELTNKIVPFLAKTQGEIVNVSSIASGPRASSDLSYYSVSKAALDQYTRNTAIALIEQGIRVNSVNPGYVVTGFATAFGFPQEASDKLMNHMESQKSCIPTRKAGRPIDIAEAIAFLADRNASSYIIGHQLVADGGSSLVIGMHAQDLAELLNDKSFAAEFLIPLPLLDIMLLSMIERVCVLVALFNNSILIYFILRKSAAKLGNYKYLMIYIAVFEMIYALMDGLTAPAVFSKDCTNLLIMRADLAYIPIEYLPLANVIFCNMFGMSMALLAIHLSTATSLKNNIQLDQISYIGFFYYPKDANGIEYIHWRSVIGIIIHSIFITISFSLIFYFGFKCYHQTRVLVQQSSQSSSFENLQSQLFYALVFQTLIPILLMHLPASVVYAGALFNRSNEYLGKAMSVSICFYPVLDPLPNFFIIKSYRKALFSFSSQIFKILSGQRETVSRQRAAVVTSVSIRK